VTLQVLERHPLYGGVLNNKVKYQTAWQLSDEELLNLLYKAKELKLDNQFIEIIQYQIYLRT